MASSEGKKPLYSSRHLQSLILIVCLLAPILVLTLHSLRSRFIGDEATELAVANEPWRISNMACFPSGIPLAQDFLQLRGTKHFQRVKSFSDAFTKDYATTLSKYSWHIPDPFMTWSRQYEYTYVYASVVQFMESSASSRCILDIGSGVTFFDYLLAGNIPGSSVIALDNDVTYPDLFKELNSLRMDHNPVRFHLQDARQDIELHDNSFDVIVCVSVLEHTDDYERIVETIHRLLRPGGAFILTFDIATSTEGTIGIQPRAAADLLSVLSKYFVEPRASPYGYSEDEIVARIRGDSGQIMDVSWVNKNIPQIGGPDSWKITISCHTFLKSLH